MKKVMFLALMSSMFVFASCFTDNEKKGGESEGPQTEVYEGIDTVPETDSAAVEANVAETPTEKAQTEAAPAEKK